MVPSLWLVRARSIGSPDESPVAARCFPSRGFSAESRAFRREKGTIARSRLPVIGSPEKAVRLEDLGTAEVGARQPELLVDRAIERYLGLSVLMAYRMEDLNAMMAVAHQRWEAACVAEDTVLAAKPGDKDDDESRFAYIRALILVMQHRETVWREYDRIAKLRQRTMTAC